MSTAADLVNGLLDMSESERRAIVASIPPEARAAILAEARRQLDAPGAEPNPARVIPWRESTRESNGGAPRNRAAPGPSPADPASAETFRGARDVQSEG